MILLLLPSLRQDPRVGLSCCGKVRWITCSVARQSSLISWVLALCSKDMGPLLYFSGIFCVEVEKNKSHKISSPNALDSGDGVGYLKGQKHLWKRKSVAKHCKVLCVCTQKYCSARLATLCSYHQVPAAGAAWGTLAHSSMLFFKC